MKIRAALLTAALFALVALTGCRTLVPMTQELRDQNHLSDADLKNLQYYVSSTITLRRELDSIGRQVTGNHKLLIAAGKTIEEVVVEANTPGVCVGVAPGVLSISFEQGTSLDFSPASERGYAPDGAVVTGARAPDPFPGNSARPVDPLTGSYFVAISGRSTVKFMGKFFEALGDTRGATLLIDAESLDRAVTRSTVLRGVKLTTK